MVQVTFLEGPHAGTTLAVAPDATPQDILCGWSGYRYRWTADYSQATAEEKAVWIAQDLSLRCVRALAQGLPVRLAGETYRAESIAQSFLTAARIEDDFLAAGKKLAIESDDETGITLKIR